MNDANIKKLGEEIIKAVKAALGDKYEEARDFAESEARAFAVNIAEIAAWRAAGKISEEQGRVLLRMHQRSMKMVLTAVEGISLVMAERAINAALGAIRDFVNGLIGWELV
jgi:hypothetical protein